MEENKKRLMEKWANCIRTIHNRIVDKVTPTDILINRERFEQVCREEWQKFDETGAEDVFIQLKTVHDVTKEEIDEIMDNCDKEFAEKLNKKVVENRKDYNYTD